MTLRLARDLPPVPYNDTLARFHANYWTIDYNALMVATIIWVNDTSFKCPAQWRTNVDFMGVKWNSEDRLSHEYCRYSTDNDYSNTILAFRNNSCEPGKTTVTIHTPGADYTYRLAPYGLNETTGLYECLDTVLSTGKTYPSTVMKNPSSWTFIDDADMVEYAGRKDYIFILDFENIKILSSFKGIKISPTMITGLSLDVVQTTNGLSSAALVTNIETTGTTGVLKATIENCAPACVLTAGDTLTNIFTAGDTDAIYEELIIVNSSSGFGTTSRIVYFYGTYHGAFISCLSLYSRYLKTTSPAVVINAFSYFYDFTATGLRTELLLKNYPQAAHDISMTSGFDDNYNRTPQIAVQQTYALGYRGFWTKYIGMSHYFNGRTAYEDKITGVFYGAEDTLAVDHPENYYFVGELWPDRTTTTTPVNIAAIEYYKAFFAALNSLGYSFVNSVAYEILDFFMPYEWSQLDYLGRQALSGWIPPSSFIQPTNTDAKNYVSAVQYHIIKLALDIGLPIRFQIGEPWWWDGSYSNFAPCLYDSATQALYVSETGNAVPTPLITNIFDPVDESQWPYIDWLCSKLGDSTNYIRDRVKALAAVDYPAYVLQATLLFFTPQIMSPSSELTRRLNFPITEWVYPNYEFVQIEDYDWIIDGRLDLVPLTFSAAVTILGYPVGVVHYFVGFILLGSDYHIWPWIDTAIKMAQVAGLTHIYIWSFTQVYRDSLLIDSTPPTVPTLPILDIPVDWSSSYDVSTEYKTEILTGRVGVEQRIAQRPTPRRTLEFTATLQGAAWHRLQAFLAGWQNRQFYLPQVNRTLRSVAPMPAATKQMTFGETLPGWVQLGAKVIIESGLWRDLRTVGRIIDSTIEFEETDALDREWPQQTLMLCAYKGYFDQSLSVKQLTSLMAQISIRYLVSPGSEVIPWYTLTPPVTYLGIEVFALRPNWVTMPSVDYQYDSEVVDYGTGVAETFHILKFSRRILKQSYWGKTRAEVELVDAFVYRMKGMQGVFFAPTWNNDLILAMSSPTTSELIVQGPEIADYLRYDSVFRNICIITKDRVIHGYRVSDATTDGVNTTLVLTASIASEVLGSILMICWMPLWRLASDILLISWQSDSVASFDIQIRSLQDVDKDQETIADAAPTPVLGITR